MKLFMQKGNTIEAEFFPYIVFSVIFVVKTTKFFFVSLTREIKSKPAQSSNIPPPTHKIV